MIGKLNQNGKQKLCATESFKTSSPLKDSAMSYAFISSHF